jgi:D-alanyl-D-alanine carboxypeptidase
VVTVALVVVLAACGGHDTSQQQRSPSRGLSPARARALGAALTKAFVGSGAPGLAVAVAAPGWTWSDGRGVSDLHSRRPVTGATPFGLASVTKPFVAALMLRLAEEGRLRLDDRLARWVPRFPGASRITLRDLLGQTSGLRDPDAAWKTMLRHPHRAMPVTTFLRGVRPVSRPGRFAYANPNYVLAGQVIERSTRTTAAVALHRELLDPLGLSDMRLQPQQAATRPLTHGYAYPNGSQHDVSDGSRYVPFTSVGTAAWTAGGLVGSATDVARFGQALFTGHLLHPASLRQMLRFNDSADIEEGYGLGVVHGSAGGYDVWGHEGQMPGFHTILLHAAKPHVTVVVLANDELADVPGIATKIIEAALPSTSSH